MNDVELIAFGFKLSTELEESSRKYHIKSSQHEILLWESGVIKAKSEFLRSGTPVLKTLQESVLLRSLERGSIWHEGTILHDVKHFHALFE